jgi:DNA modification methylase
MGWFYGSGLFRCPWGFLGWQPILVYGKDPYLARGLGARPDSTHLNASDGDTKDSGHPCPKPNKFWDWLLERCSPEKGEIVYEPFCGSGITIVACERLGRKCRAIEISPAYCAVAIERFYQMTGIEPMLLNGNEKADDTEHKE